MRRSHLAPALTSSRSSGVRIGLSVHVVSDCFEIDKYFECTFVGCFQIRLPWGIKRGGWVTFSPVPVQMLSQPGDRSE